MRIIKKQHPIAKWLGTPYEWAEGKKAKKFVNGQPQHLRLLSYENDRALKTSETVGCCDCGMVHLETYEVFQCKGQYWLVTRSFQISDASKLKRQENKFNFVKRGTKRAARKKRIQTRKTRHS